MMTMLMTRLPCLPRFGTLSGRCRVRISSRVGVLGLRPRGSRQGSGCGVSSHSGIRGWLGGGEGGMSKGFGLRGLSTQVRSRALLFMGSYEWIRNRTTC